MSRRWKRRSSGSGFERATGPSSAGGAISRAPNALRCLHLTARSRYWLGRSAAGECPRSLMALGGTKRDRPQPPAARGSPHVLSRVPSLSIDCGPHCMPRCGCLFTAPCGDLARSVRIRGWTSKRCAQVWNPLQGNRTRLHWTSDVSKYVVFPNDCLSGSKEWREPPMDRWSPTRDGARFRMVCVRKLPMSRIYSERQCRLSWQESPRNLPRCPLWW